MLTIAIDDDDDDCYYLYFYYAGGSVNIKSKVFPMLLDILAFVWRCLILKLSNEAEIGAICGCSLAAFSQISRWMSPFVCPCLS